MDAITTTATELEDPATARTATVALEPHSSNDNGHDDQALLTVLIPARGQWPAERVAVTLTPVELEQLLHAAGVALDHIAA